MNHALKSSVLTITGAFIFMVFALYNGYPIVMSGDTSTYLMSGFDLYVPAERPVFYGLFIRITSLGATIWTTIFIQCLILSYVCVRFIRSLLPAISDRHLYVILILVALATISSWYAGQIVPDIFTPILFLAFYLFLTQKNTLQQKILLSGIIYLSIIVHNSNYVTSTLFIAAIFVLSFIDKKRFFHLRRKLIYLSPVVLFSWASLLTTNYIAGNGFVVSRASHVFLMGKLAESGVLKTYLDKACPVKDYKICNFKDDMPPVAWGFVWDTENSPVFKAGGWDSTKKEYDLIIKDIISRPKYWPFLAYKSFEATMRQVILLNIDEAEELPWRKFDKEDIMYKTINRIFPHEINEFMFGRQNLKTLNIPFYDDVYVVVFLLSAIMCLLLLKGEELNASITVYALVLLFVLINAFTTATFGNVLSRLNSRAIWLIPMVNIIFIYRFFAAKLKVPGKDM